MTSKHEFRAQPVQRPELGRERVRQACHRCRLKKLKCDGIVPCGRCIKDDMLCQHRERKGTGTEQSHSEYVSRLEEQQRILAAALKLTWLRLYPDESDAMPSAHEIICRLKMMPNVSCQQESNSCDAQICALVQNPSFTGADVATPPELNQGQLESALSSTVSTPAATHGAVLLVSEYDFTLHSGQDEPFTTERYSDFAHSPNAPEWTEGEPASLVYTPNLAISKSPPSAQRSGHKSAQASQDLSTVEPWQLMIE